LVAGKSASRPAAIWSSPDECCAPTIVQGAQGCGSVDPGRRSCKRRDEIKAAALTKAFYASIPADVKSRGEWAATDQSHNVTLLEAPDIEAVRRIQAPFEKFTETVVAQVTIKGWKAG